MSVTVRIIKLPRRLKGLTLLEILLAVAITMAFLGGAVLSFVEIVRATDRSEAKLDAVSNARHALDKMSVEFRRAYRGDPSDPPLFLGLSSSLSFGDRADNDGDGEVDEEELDGKDNDNDWIGADDNHAEIAPVLFDRDAWAGRSDLGDLHVDEDVNFRTADVTFRTFPDGLTTGTRQVRYLLGNYNGEDNVLMQEITTDAGGPDQAVTTGPLAFNVVSFSALFWDQADATPDNKYWKTSWDATTVDPAFPELPITVNLNVIVYAGHPQPLQNFSTTEPMPTVALSTTVLIEAVKGDPFGRYNAIRNTY